MAAESPGTAILWYRRDLRLHDHPALEAARSAERLLPVFVFDDRLLHGRFASTTRTTFMLGCLAELRQQLRRRGSDLITLHGQPERLLPQLASELGAGGVYWTSDVSPFARERDLRVTEALREAGIRAEPREGNYIVDVSRLRTSAGEPFRVFSPFWRQWRALERRTPAPTPRALPPLPSAVEQVPLPGHLAERGPTEGAGVLMAAGEPAARAAMRQWLREPIAHYADRQNGMARRGTSRLSPYLRWGCLSPLELERRAGERGGRGAEAWIRQLCWREFYAHVLLMWPDNLRHEFQERFRDLRWDGTPEHLGAWQRGETGYPAVDAGMRELAQTGWMHNRSRLIVGSFLTKDLHLDWREGERWFERLLLDGEPAQNNGNWQWIASVGVDPAPAYRRMYNPALQGQRFDPGGDHVRRWVPELAGVPDARLWEPWRMSDSEQRQSGCRIGVDYPGPIVDHAQERRRALERYRTAGDR